MSGVINTGSFSKLLWPGLNAIYGKTYSEFPVKWDKLYEKHTSDRAYEEDLGISSFGLAAVKPEGAPISYDIEQQGFLTRYTHLTYALGFIITKEMFEDDQYAIVGEKRAKGLAFSMRQTKEIVAHTPYNKAFAGAGNPTYGDGKTMIANDHPNVAGGTWSNTLAVAADLSEAALEQATIDIKKFTNDRGLRIAVQPQSLIIPVELQYEAERLLKTTGRVGTDLNDINTLTGMFPKGVVDTPYLTDPDAWFIRTNAPEGLKYFERVADTFEMDNDFDTDNAKFKARARHTFGITDPRAIYASPGA